MQLKDFHFDLPAELIARYPLATRSSSRLLYLNGKTGEIAHKHFHHLLDYLEAGDLLVFNDTKVIPARLLGTKSTGGQVEILIERLIANDKLTAQIRASKSPKVGDVLHFADGFYLEVIDRKGIFYTLHYPFPNITMLQFIERIGQIPLPPYMQRKPESLDKERYQTVYAKNDGSVAAPTAGFHFDTEMLQTLVDKQVDMSFLTLHIGAGTFAPVRVEDIREHQMHMEYLTVSESLCKQVQETKSKGKRVVAVGTTSVRALETAAQSGQLMPYQGETNIFIYPGYKFQCADAMVTNLHLPGSTLLMLVSAFAGHSNIMRAYQEAVKHAYRFYSYGDAMFLTKAE